VAVKKISTPKRRAVSKPKAPSKLTEETLNGVFQNRALGMAIFDLNGKSIEANSRFNELIGGNADVMLADNGWKDIVAPEWKSRKKTEWKQVAKGDFFRGHETEVTNKRGKPVVLLVSGSVIEKSSNGNHTLFLSIEDITARKREEDKLLEANDKLLTRANTSEKQLKAAKGQLSSSKQEVTRTTRSFQKLNDAMKVLLSEFQDQKGDLENRIVSNFNLTVEPIIEHLKALDVPEPQRHLLDTLDFSIKNITSYFGINIGRQGANLSPREIQICQMIREGKDSREIAKTMGVSYQTVIVHRKNIRRKLGIKKVKQNLATYLQQNM
jgi:PAS domain S-box-containing protein